MLPPIPELEFSEEAHKYKYDGKWLHLSPTQVLSFDLDEQAKRNIAETKEGPDGWEIRGNTLHGCLEQFLLGAADLNPGDFTEWWKPLKACWLWEDAKILGVELRMTDKKRMGGSCDFLIQMPTGEICLGDLKSVASEKACKARKPATAQLGGYLYLLSKSYPKVMVDKCVTVVAGPGKCRVITDDPTDCWLAWEDAMSRYQAHVDIKYGF
jgi:hypothetical protein